MKDRLTFPRWSVSGVIKLHSFKSEFRRLFQREGFGSRTEYLTFF